jgi:hypothetical protein
LCCLRQCPYLMRGSVPARRDTFLYSRRPWRSPFGPAFGGSVLLLQHSSGKVSKTMAPGPRPPAGRVRCDARPIRRVWNSRLRRSDNQTLAPDWPALLAGAKVAGRASIEHHYPDGGGATFALPSIVARRGNERGLSEPPQAASSRAPRRARSAGESERSADQGNGAGLLGTFGPSKVPRPAGTEPRIQYRPCRRQSKAFSMGLRD